MNDLKILKEKTTKKESVKIREDESWDSTDGSRETAMKAAQSLREFLKKKPKYHLQIERGRVDRAMKAFTNPEEDQEDE